MAQTATEAVQLSWTDEQLTNDAVAARQEAESVEIEASPSRWREADDYAELSIRGWSVRRIADACGTNKDTVSICVRMVSRYLDRDARPTFWKAYEAVTAPSDEDAEKMAHVGHNAGDNEWYTPEAYIEAAKDVMGGIDLDPASTETANEIVGATEFYTAEENGLSKPWAGRVWMNPPYAQPEVALFSERLASLYEAGSVTEACVLVNNATETAWFTTLAERASAICFPKGRVRFWHPEKESAPLQGQAVVYLGLKTEAFCKAFEVFGTVWVAAD